MNDKESFQEMMRRYNHELVRMQQRGQPATAGQQWAKHQANASTRQQTVPAKPEVLEKASAPPPPVEHAPCERSAATDRSQTVGENGPVVLQDSILHERLEIFVNTKTIERAVHVKGWGALGSFQPYQSMKAYTSSGFLQNPGQKTPVLVRFSQAGSTKGSPDTARDIRGFAVKFYTTEGVFDLVGNHIPVFFVQDAMRFPETLAALSPDPISNLPDPNRFWGFIARVPEATHALLWLYSDLGTVASYRFIRGFGVNTFVWKNAEGARRYVKYHWLPLAGEKCIDRQEARRLAGENPDVAGQDLHDTLASGGHVEYELCVQLMDPSDTAGLPYDPLDDTKVWDEAQYPLMPVGRLTLERNPENYQAQVEEAAFSPANLVEGIELSADKMLQGRSFVYWDAQRRRLGPGFRSLPVNRFTDWSVEHLVTSGEGTQACGPLERAGNSKADSFAQAGEFYRALPEQQREHLVGNIAVELRAAAPTTQTCVVGYLDQADRALGDGVRREMAALEQ